MPTVIKIFLLLASHINLAVLLSSISVYVNTGKGIIPSVRYQALCFEAAGMVESVCSALDM